MNYNWDINDLVKNIATLEEKYSNTTDLNEKQMILQVINRINTYIVELNMEKRGICNNASSLDEQYSKFICAYYNFLPYSDLINSYYYSLTDAELEDYDESHVISKGLSIDDYFCSIHDFYKQLDSEFYNYFIQLYKDRFICYKIDTSYSEAYGAVYNIPYLNKSYIVQCYNEKHPNCSEILTGVHEYGHGIASIINNKRYLDFDYIDEIESTFFELVAVDYYSSVLKTNEFYKQAYDSMVIQYDNCDYSYDIEKYIKRYTNLLKHGKMLEELNKEKKKNFSIFSGSDLYTEYKYLVSYIVALNLYMTYLSDREYALYLLKEIVKSNYDNEFITINKCVGDDSRVLQYKMHLDKKLSNY